MHKEFNIKIYSTDTDVPSKEIKDIMDAVNSKMRGGEILRANVQHYSRKSSPKVTEDGGMDWNWFQKNLTRPAVAQGYNIVVYHCTRKDRTKFGFRKKLNGAYRTDIDAILEFWLSADYKQKAKHYTCTEFRRVFMHELLHGFFRRLKINTMLVHKLDYDLGKLESGFEIVNFNK